MLGGPVAYRRRRGRGVNFVYHLQCAYHSCVFVYHLRMRTRIYDRAWLPALSLIVTTKRTALVDKYFFRICNWSVSGVFDWPSAKSYVKGSSNKLIGNSYVRLVVLDHPTGKVGGKKSPEALED